MLIFLFVSHNLLEQKPTISRFSQPEQYWLMKLCHYVVLSFVSGYDKLHTLATTTCLLLAMSSCHTKALSQDLVMIN
jgi:hypothetical protein